MRLAHDAIVRKNSVEAADPIQPLGDCSDEFDEDYYLKMNPDVAAAVQAGTAKDGLTHFMMQGAAEGRKPPGRVPLGVEFGEAYYLKKYADVAAAVQAGTMKDGLTHFIMHGAAEGRRPSGRYPLPVVA